MSTSDMDYLEFGAPSADADLCVVLMHGLGADGHDFADVAQALVHAAAPRKWRFVLPHAPQMPVTINMGMRMPAWYDILRLDHPRGVNWDSVGASQRALEALVASQAGARKAVLAGFSQGAAMALHLGLRHQDSTDGVLMMSGYLLESEDHPCPAKRAEFPIGLFHGTHDPVVPFVAAEETVASLQEAGFSPTLARYEGLEHSVSEQELRDVFDWLSRVSSISHKSSEKK